MMLCKSLSNGLRARRASVKTRGRIVFFRRADLIRRMGRRHGSTAKIPHTPCETVLLRPGLKTGLVEAGWIGALRRPGAFGWRRRGAGRLPGCRGISAAAGREWPGLSRRRVIRSVSPSCVRIRQPKTGQRRPQGFRVSALCPCRLLPETIGPTYPTWPGRWLTPAPPRDPHRGTSHDPPSRHHRVGGCGAQWLRPGIFLVFGGRGPQRRGACNAV